METVPAAERLVEVLVVDDEEDTRVILRDYFAAHDIRVRVAASGEAALAELTAACPDAMVLDIRMPKIDGLAVLRFVRSSTRLRHLPVLALSAHALADEVHEMEQAGIDAYLAKPAHPRVVLDTVRSLLAAHPVR